MCSILYFLVFSVLAAESSDSFAVNISGSSQALETPLDKRRLRLIQRADELLTLGDEDHSYPTPNLTLKRRDNDHYYQEKALTILGLVDAGLAPDSRIREANALLRTMFARWPANKTADLIGQYAKAWNHHSRILATRIYALYSKWLEPDIQQQFLQRFRYMLTGPFNRQSENIKFTNNCACFLAHEFLGETSIESYKQLKNWLIESMRRIGKDGAHEWGSTYNMWTMGAILNLAEFAQDSAVRNLATMLVDYFLAQQSGFCIGGNYCSGGVRRYRHWTLAYPTPQMLVSQLLFTGDPQPVRTSWVEWAVSNYRPPKAVAALYQNSATGESNLTTGPHQWRYRCYRGEQYAIANHQAVMPGHFVLPTGGTHDIVGCFIQSTKAPGNHIVPYGHPVTRQPKKKRNLTERYFGYKNVVFVNHGGTTRAVWAGGGKVTEVPVRLFYTTDFHATFENGWAFLTDEVIYVAWRPTKGEAMLDPDSETFSDPDKEGKWLRSSHVPGDEGETCVIEVGDAASYGDFEAFKQDILGRNPRPKWIDGKVVYVAKDQTLLEFGSDYARTNGVDFSPDSYPRAEMPGLHGYTLTSDDGEITFDFDNIVVTGLVNRMTTNRTFGVQENGK